MPDNEGKPEEIEDAAVIRAALADAVWAFEGLVLMRDLDPCEAEELCGDDVCKECGCICDKLALAKSAYARARAPHQMR